MASYSPELLRRWPDVEAPGLVATDAADRLILDESAAARREARRLVVIGDEYGALTLGAADAGATGIRVHQDSLAGERALAANADAGALDGTFDSLPLDGSLLGGADVVLMRLPRSLDALDDIARTIAAHANSDVVVFAGGREKHMAMAMNDVFRASFGRLDISHARQKSRVLIAREPLADVDSRELTFRVGSHRVHGLDQAMAVRVLGGVFAGTSVDIGTRFLLENLTDAPLPLVEGDVIDLACGSGIVASWLALTHPERRIRATDQSAAAVLSTRATAEANGVGDRVEAIRDIALSSRADESAAFIALNPPFHAGSAVPAGGVAEPLFADAGRTLARGGQLWAVWNTTLGYRSALERLVGPTRQVARNRKFTVTVSTKR